MPTPSSGRGDGGLKLPMNPGMTPSIQGLRWGKWDKGATQTLLQMKEETGKGSSVKVKLIKEGDEKEGDGRHLNLRRNRFFK